MSWRQTQSSQPLARTVDNACLSDLTAVDWTHRNTLCVNSVSMETTMPGVFAAGDAVTGPATVIEAIGGGKPGRPGH